MTLKGRFGPNLTFLLKERTKILNKQKRKNTWKKRKYKKKEKNWSSYASAQAQAWAYARLEGRANAP